MKLRLIYTGELKASQAPHPNGGKEKHIIHKHNIRKDFHSQLKQFWEKNTFLKSAAVEPAQYGVDKQQSDFEAIWCPDKNGQVPLSKAVANVHQKYGYKFVPLVRKDWLLVCNLRILLLRQDGTHSLISAGDIDNRVKTVIDALTMPTSQLQLEKHENPAANEDPFFCLLENDRLITGLEVETDRLLKTVDSGTAHAPSWVHVVISAEIRPAEKVTLFNLSFA